MRGRPGASGYAPGHAAEDQYQDEKAGWTTGLSVNIARERDNDRNPVSIQGAM